MMPKQKSEKAFRTEAELCSAFIGAVERTKKWTAYPETRGWDILLSRNADGCQIGVEAKLILNLKVLSQAIEDFSMPSLEGPDYRAVLVPENNGIGAIPAYLGITVITLQTTSYERDRGLFTISPHLPEAGAYGDWGWYGWCPGRRHRLPDYVPDVVAGAPAPVRLTEWKIAAIKLAIILESRAVTRQDFKAIGLDHRRWTAKGSGWLEPTPEGWIWGKRRFDLSKEHPINYEQIKADSEKWMPKLQQGSLL